MLFVFALIAAMLVTVGIVLSGGQILASIPVQFKLGAAVLVVTAIVSAVLFVWWRRHRALQRKKALQLHDIDRMSGHDFEFYVADILKFRGCQNVQVTQKSGDFGADILFTKDGVKYAAQVKRSRSQIGVKALYEAAGGEKYYKADKSVVITNSFYTPAAQSYSRESGVLLVNRPELIEWMVAFQNSK